MHGELSCRQWGYVPGYWRSQRRHHHGDTPLASVPGYNSQTGGATHAPYSNQTAYPVAMVPMKERTMRENRHDQIVHPQRVVTLVLKCVGCAALLMLFGFFLVMGSGTLRSRPPWQ